MCSIKGAAGWILIAALTGGCGSSPHAKVAALEAEAHRACLCERAAGQGPAAKACWDEFQRRLKGMETSRITETSIPTGPVMVCIDEAQKFCAVEYYDVRASAEKTHVCSLGEAKAIDTAFTKGDAAGGTEVGLRAANLAAKRIIHGGSGTDERPAVR